MTPILASIIAGCVIFSFMPAEMGILGWILFAIGTLLSIIGIFRLVSMIPEEKGDPARKVVTGKIGLSKPLL